MTLRGYYAILDLRGGGDPVPEAEAARAAELLAARPCCLQLRAKDLADRALLAVARAIAPLCRAAGIPFCVNDRVDLAVLAGAEVVHLGQDDLSIADARRVLAGMPGGAAAKLVVGVSTHSLAQALAAEAAGADYIGFGPVFATGSKQKPDPVVGIEGLRAVTAAVRIPVVAIGGITRASLGAVIAAGASAAAVIADIETANDRAAAASAVAAAFRSQVDAITV